MIFFQSFKFILVISHGCFPKSSFQNPNLANVVSYMMVDERPKLTASIRYLVKWCNRFVAECFMAHFLQTVPKWWVQLIPFGFDFFNGRIGKVIPGF